jgi:hypothetical protein
MVLGDMFELQDSLEEHKAIVSKLSNAKDFTLPSWIRNFIPVKQDSI